MAFGFFLGICAAFLWSIVNLIDKYLVERFSKDTGIGALIILSSLFPSVLLPISFELAGRSIELPILQITVLIISGFLTTIWITFYLLALENEDTSIVVPLIFQLTPIFALPLAFVFLSELPSAIQLIAGAIIILGSLILVFEHTTGKLKWRLILFITVSSVSVALMNTLFKFVAIDASFWISIFWHVVGITISGLFLLFFHATYRSHFIAFISENMGFSLTLNAFNETLTIIGDVIFAYAILLAPLALIQTTEAFQPIFVFFIGLLLVLIAPSWVHEDLSKASVIKKVAGISLVVLGSLILYI